MKIGLFFPLKTLATSDARRPNVCPVASTTYQSLVMVDGLAIKLFMSRSHNFISLSGNCDGISHLYSDVVGSSHFMHGEPRFSAGSPSCMNRYQIKVP